MGGGVSLVVNDEGKNSENENSVSMAAVGPTAIKRSEIDHEAYDILAANSKDDLVLMSAASSRKNSPRSYSDENITPTEPGKIHASVARYKRILVVDDSELSRKVVINMLKKIHFADEFLEAENGYDAIEISMRSQEEDNAIRLILLDYLMPELDGPGTAQRLRARGFTGIIIGVTCLTEASAMETFIAHGADSVLTKRLRASQLLATLGLLEADKAEKAVSNASPRPLIRRGNSREGGGKCKYRCALIVNESALSSRATAAALDGVGFAAQYTCAGSCAEALSIILDPRSGDIETDIVLLSSSIAARDDLPAVSLFRREGYTKTLVLTRTDGESDLLDVPGDGLADLIIAEPVRVHVLLEGLSRVKNNSPNGLF